MMQRRTMLKAITGATLALPTRAASRNLASEEMLLIQNFGPK
jgi:hypothetical protein